MDGRMAKTQMTGTITGQEETDFTGSLARKEYFQGINKVQGMVRIHQNE